jgi:signal transduction histidine kinase
MAKRLAAWFTFMLVVVGLAPTAHALDEFYDGYVRLADGWRMQLGDDQGWAARRFDDSGWPTGSTVLYDPPEGFDGEVWLRRRFTMSGARSLAFRVQAYGPYELHVDGRKVVAFGDLPEFDYYGAPVYVDVDDAEHVIALHVRNPDWRSRIFEGFPAGVRVDVTTEERARTTGHKSALTRHVINSALVCGALAIGLMNLILLWFNRRQKHHFYFAIFSLGFALTHVQSIAMIGVTGTDDLEPLLIGVKIGITLFACGAVLTLHMLLLEPTRRFRRALEIGMAIGIVLSPWAPFPAYFLVVIATMLECIRVSIVGLMRKHEAAPLVAVGCAALVAGNVDAVRYAVSDGPGEFHHGPGLGTMALLVCISVSLSRELARAKQAEVDKATLHAKQAELVQSEKMDAMGVLVAGIAHEVNTPLGAIRSAGASIASAQDKLDAWLEKNLTADKRDKRLSRTLRVVRDSAAIVDTATSRVTDVVERLKSFAKLDQAESQLTDLNETVRTTLATVRHKLDDIDVTTELTELPDVLCVPRQINQVLVNVLLNAADAIDTNGSIHIATRRTDAHAVIEITDDGCGIEPSVLPKIFDPGFTTKGVGVGAGLGLAISHQIVDAHDGNIRATSKPGQGTTLTIDLPLTAA